MLTELAVSAVVHAGPMVSGPVLSESWFSGSWLSSTVGPTVNPGSGGDPGTASIPTPDTVSPGFAGFATVFLLTCATILLIRSMVKHLRKVRYSPEPPEPPEPLVAPGAEVSDATGNVTGHSPVSPGEDRSAAN
jgi:hypothetical protein